MQTIPSLKIQMPKILHITNTDVQDDSRILKEIESLSKLPGVLVFSIGVNANNSSNHVNISFGMYKAIKLYARLFKFIPRSIRYLFELIEFTFKVLRYGVLLKPDIVHCHDTFALPAGAILKYLINCDIVYDAHELESDKNGQNLILSKATLLIEMMCWHTVDLFISVSNSIINWYIKKFGSKPSVLVLNSPVYTKNSLRKNQYITYLHDYFKIPYEHTLYVYVGVLGTGRGIDIYLNTFKNISSNHHLIFLGSGDLDVEILNYSSKYSNIHLHPPVTHELVVPIVSSADFGLCVIQNVSLSDYFCLPNKLLEYAFSGVSVIGSNFPEILDVIERYNIGLTCEPNLIGFQGVMNSLVNSRPIFKFKNLQDLDWMHQSDKLNIAYLNLLKI